MRKLNSVDEIQTFSPAAPVTPNIPNSEIQYMPSIIFRFKVKIKLHDICVYLPYSVKQLLECSDKCSKGRRRNHISQRNGIHCLASPRCSEHYSKLFRIDANFRFENNCSRFYFAASFLWLLILKIGKYSQMVLSTFSHVQPFHVFFNMLALFSMSTMLASSLPVEQFLAFYLSSGTNLDFYYEFFLVFNYQYIN